MDDIVTKIFATLGTFFTGLFMFGLNRHAQTLRDIKTDIARTNSDLARHQLDVAQNYARENTIGRIHDRLDKMDEKFDKKMELVGSDIKTLLQMTKGQGK